MISKSAFFNIRDRDKHVEDHRYSSSKSAEDVLPSPFSILLIGELCDAVPGTTTFSSIDRFLKKFSIEIKDKSLFHLVQRDNNVIFGIYILKNIWHNLYYNLCRHILKQPHLIFLLPYSMEDFEISTNFLTKYQSCLSPHIKIYYLNEFPKDSQEYSVIAEKATLLNYRLVDKDELNTVLENERIAYLKNPQAFFSDEIEEKTTTPATKTPETEMSSKCALL